MRAGYRAAVRFALLYGAGVAAVFSAAAPWLAAIFTADPQVVRPLVAYIRIVSLGYGMMEVHRYGGFVLTGLQKPASTTALNVVRIGLFLIPLSILGARGWGLTGLFAGRLLTDLAVGGIGLAWVGWVLARRSAPAAGPAAPSYHPASTSTRTVS